MKINDKHLAIYGTSPEGIDKEGFLSKKGEVNKVFQRRWFVLKGNLLFYGEKRGEKPNGVIILEDCSVEVSDADRYSFTISFFGGRTRVYILSADTEDDMISWMKRISTAPFSYAAMVAKELEKRLEKLKKNEDELLAKQKEESAKLAHENGRTQDSNDISNEDGSDFIDDADNLFGEINNTSFEPKGRSLRKESSPKPKYNANRNTINVAANPKSFNNLLTVVKAGAAMKNNILPYVRRSKSSENLHKLTSKSPATSPVPPRRKFPQSVRRKKLNAVRIEHNIDPNVVIDTAMTTIPIANTKENLPEAPAKSVFYVLHNQYAASVWTAIKEYESGSCEDLLRFE